MSRVLELLAILALLSWFYAADSGASPPLIVANLAIIYALLVRSVCTVSAPHGIRTYFTVETLFLTFFFLIFYWPYQQYLLGNYDIATSRFLIYTFPAGTNEAMILCSVGAIAFSMGYRTILRGRGGVQTARPVHAAVDQVEYARRSGGVAGVFLVLVCGVYLAAGMRTEGEGRYTGTESGGSTAELLSSVILVLALVVIGCWLYLRSTKENEPWLLRLGLLTSVVWSLRWVALGDRNSFLLIAIALVGGYFTFVRRASLLAFVIGLALALGLYNAVEILRSPQLLESVGIWGAITGGGASQTSDESSFNITTMTVRASVEVVPAQYPFAGGSFKLVGLLGIFPLFRGLYVYLIQPEYVTSADLLGDVMLGPNAVWNVGSNIVSDSYLDFGALGVLAILSLLGALAGLATRSVSRSSYSVTSVVVYVAVLALFAELPRYSADFPVRVITWAALFLFVMRLFLARRRRAAV